MVGSKISIANATTLYLPNDCWENIVKFLINDQPSLESLSLVSKQLLSVTNRFKFSLTIRDDQTLNPIFHRFPNITSLNLNRFGRLDRSLHNLDELLCKISNCSLQLKSLNLSNPSGIPSKGFQALAKKFKTSLKSLICSKLDFLNHTDLELIANCFPFLEELELSLIHPKIIPDKLEFNLGIQALSLALPNLRKFNLSNNWHITDSSFLQLFKNCVFLEEVVMFSCKLLTIHGIAFAIRERPNLNSFFTDSGWNTRMYLDNSQLIHSLASLEDLNCLHLSDLCISDCMLSSIRKEALPWRKLVLYGCHGFTYDGIFSLVCKCRFLQHLGLQNVDFLNDQHVADLSLNLGKLVYINVRGCRKLTNSAMFALLRNCPLLGEIRMAYTRIGECNVVKDFDSVNPHHRVKSLDLGWNSGLKDETIKYFASIFPNLELLDLSLCEHISDEGVFEVLRRCLKIRHLTGMYCPRLRLLRMNFQVPKLEVLSLSHSSIDDEALYWISKSCSGLLELELEGCDVTDVGVRLVIENCTKLRKIDLLFCHKLTADVFPWIVNSRPSLRKIAVPHCSTDNGKKLLLEHGCLIGYGIF